MIRTPPCDDEEQWLAALRTKFAARLPEHRAGLMEMHTAGDRDGLIERAHKLAGIAGMMGAPEVGDTALQFEEALRAETDGAAEFDALMDAIDRTLG